MQALIIGDDGISKGFQHARALKPHEIDTPIWQKVHITPQNPMSSEAFALQTLTDLGY